MAPATGTPESGGWTTREVRRFIKGLEGIHLIGADVVEVSPPYDTIAEVTCIAATDLLVDILALMSKAKAGPAEVNSRLSGFDCMFPGNTCEKHVKKEL
jgi:agmatinase